MKRLLGLALLALPVLSASNDAQVGGGGNPVGCVCNIAKSYEPNDPNVSGDPSLPPWVTGIAVLVHMPSPAYVTSCPESSRTRPVTKRVTSSSSTTSTLAISCVSAAPADPMGLGGACNVHTESRLTWYK